MPGLMFERVCPLIGFIAFHKSRSRPRRDLLKVIYGPFVSVGVGVSMGGKGVRVSVGEATTGMDVSVGNAVGGITVGDTVGEAVGVGKLRLRVTFLSA